MFALAIDSNKPDESDLPFVPPICHSVTNAGVHLVAHTIQVKTNLAPKPSGGKGPPAFHWWVPDDCPAELFELATRRISLLNHNELATPAQQHTNGQYHRYGHARHGAHRLATFLFENRLAELFL